MSSDLEPPPYKVYRAAPRGLRARLRGEEEALLPKSGRPQKSGPAKPRDGWSIAKRVLKYVAIAVVAWIVLSVVLFLVSAADRDEQAAELGGERRPLLGAEHGHGDRHDPDHRHRSAAEGFEARPGARHERRGQPFGHADAVASRRRHFAPAVDSRDTVASIPGHGTNKINAAYAYGGPALTIRTVEQFTGIKINHVIIVNLAAFPPFINAIGGVNVKTGRVCSVISGGPANGGFSLFLKPGVHHLNGEQALVYARTRENRCNPNDSDLTRVEHQQEILNAIKSKLVSPSSFFRLPLASWDAPKVLRTDMGGFTLLSLFGASEIGGNAPVDVLKPTGSIVLPDGEDGLTATPGDVSRAVNKLMTGR